MSDIDDGGVAGQRLRIINLLADMPYASDIPRGGLILNDEEEMFLDELFGVLDILRYRLALAVQAAENMHTDLDELRTQRSAVRAFLGLPDGYQ